MNSTPVGAAWPVLHLVCCLAIAACFRSAAQDQAPPLRISAVDISGSLRGRVENWDWFSAPPAGESYTYGAAILRIDLRQSLKHLEWRAEGAFPLLVNLPANAIAPDPAGPLGYGGDYFLANGRRDIGAAVLRQAFLGVKTGDGRFKLRAGRFEFADGSEAAPRDPELAALKKDRVNQRLIATFNYALRSLDGAEFSYDCNHSNVTAMAARVVEGSFQLRALNEIDVALAYGAYTRYIQRANAPSEFRFFVVSYWDSRDVLKSDNRPLALREADHRPIRLATPGAHFIAQRKLGQGTADVVLWGAGQFGSWGAQQHLAAELAVEAGYRFAMRANPWIRIGYLRSTGDSNPGDASHGTFFQILSSPRNYARFPFYVLMNSDDRFFQFRAAPARKLALRSELHSVRLASGQDLWYDGGGPFQQGTFGYLGRPSGGRSRIGTSLDLSADVALSGKTTVSLYGGLARGSAVPAFVFPAGGQKPIAHLLSVEVVRRF